MQDLTIPGVPYALLHDGWWLSETAETTAPQTPRPPAPPHAVTDSPRPSARPAAALALLLLISLADVLFWHQWLGLSLAVFALAVMVAIRAASRSGSTGDGRVALAIAALSVLPVIERVQPLSFLFLLGGLLVFAAHAGLGRALPINALFVAMLRLAAHLPWFSAWTLAATARQITARQDGASLFDRARRAWTVPLLVGMIFVALLASANPLIETWLDRTFAFTWLSGSAVARLIFWAGLAWLLWPLLSAARLTGRISPEGDAPFPAPARTLAGINPASVANSLVLFNLIFAVQTLLDLTYLWSAAALPAGMSHAEYAHRGAYPLVVTALLAGAFALVSRPFTEGSRPLRALLALWIGQNVMLVVSSLYRLGLYVEAYGLTYLRVAAAIWMALVAAGLVLTFWQLLRRRGNLWLLARTSVLLVATLYACAFVNFAQIIARTNLELYRTGSAPGLDLYYLCSLDPTAAGALRDFQTETDMNLDACGDMLNGPQTHGWRDWGFRSWRVQRYLSATQPGPMP